IVAITMDQKGVPMRNADLLEATRKAAEKRNPRLQHRRSKGEKPHRKRLSTVAAVYTVPPFVRTAEQIVGEMGPVHEVLPKRPRPEDKRVWASVKQPLDEILIQVFDEATRRDPHLAKRWVALVDGDESQLNAMKLAAKEYGVSLVIILDIIHVLEYLWKAAFAFHKEGDPAAESWVKERLARILRGESSLVAAGMRRSATLNKLDEKQREPVDSCANYLLKYAPYIRYDQYLAEGYPIATGIIEGACRYVVKDRMEITGARWSLQGAEDVLRLRSLRASGDFDEYWEFHLRQEYERNHVKKYKDGRVPSLPPAAQGKQKAASLKLVRQKRAAENDEKDQETRCYDSLETISLKKRDGRKR
ncbi:MAG: ISKra4 family transposase, partial [Blastocatellia bacterium]|nr:ISKra4 family transposase [Blastocatellia bacterium]